MKPAVLAFVVLWQLGSRAASGPRAGHVSEPQHLRYERVLDLHTAAAGQACAVLDEAVFAHSASSTVNDLRLYASRTGAPETETPFAFMESGSSSADTQSATLGPVTVHDGSLSFDLAMPARSYTEVDLDLDAKNFVGVAEVSAYDAQQRRPMPLGSFPVFDLSDRGLPRSTSIRLPESRFADLQIELRLTDLSDRPLPNVSPAMVKEATVPPAHVHQTMYTTVASSAMEQQEHSGFASFIVPAHVPIERVRIVPGPKSPPDFLYEVTVTANPLENGREALGAAEGASGHIFRVRADAQPNGLPAIDTERLSMDTALGANLRSSARVTVTLENGSAPPLAIQQIDLQMRQRAICFDAQPGTLYTLRYGDAALSAPVYAYARHFVAAASPIVAVLGPEQANPQFVARSGNAPHERQQTQFFWVVLLAVVCVAGVLGLQYVRYKHEEMR